MIELPEKVTVVMYKDKRGNLYKTQQQAMIADQAVEKLRISEELSHLIYYYPNLRGYTFRDSYRDTSQEISEISETLLEFLSEKWSEVVPLVQAYVRVKKAV